MKHLWWLMVGLVWVLVTLPTKTVQAADVTVPTNVPVGFDTPSDTSSSAPSHFRTQPNWYAHGYIVSYEAAVDGAEDGGSESYGSPVGAFYYYAIATNNETVPMRASFDKYGDYYNSDVQIHTKMEEGTGPVIKTGGDFGADPSIGIHNNFDAVWIGEEYDYIDYELTFPKVSVPTWFRYQIDVVMKSDNREFHSDIFPVLVVPDNWQAQLTATSQVLFAGQSTTVGIAGMENTIQPQYTWEQAHAIWQPSGNQLQVTNTDGQIADSTLQASLTIPQRPDYTQLPTISWQPVMTFQTAPLHIYQARLADQSVAFGDDATFDVVLPPGLTITSAQWLVDGEARASPQSQLVVPDVMDSAAVQWQATLTETGGQRVPATATAQLTVQYPDALILQAVPQLQFMAQSTTGARDPTVAELIAGTFSGNSPPVLPAPNTGSSWLVTPTTGELRLVDGRVDANTPWQLSVKLGAFSGASKTITDAGMFLITTVKGVVQTSPQITPTGSAEIVATDATREWQADVQGLLKINAIKDVQAGTYRATVTWEVAAVPTP
ncbi:hypothetical protein [Lacticaseibacillus sp. GG6-2]